MNARVAYVDLNAGRVWTESLEAGVRRRLLGGRALNVWLLLRHLPKGVDPLGPDNVLVFGAGLLTGTAAPSAARFNVTAKSPLTGFLGDSNCGGFWGPELRFAGFDHLVILGQAKEPVYLFVNRGRVEIRRASHLWGKDTYETQRMIRQELGDPAVQVACIGPAGERLVRFACVRHGFKNAAGRTGMGAVMGSKRLKAIAVRGHRGVPVRDPRGLLGLREELYRSMSQRKVFPILRTYGTSFLMDAHQRLGNLGVRNNQQNQMEEGWEALSSVNLKRYSLKMLGCYGCFLHCRHAHLVPRGPRRGAYAEGPEYFPLNNLGAKTAVYDLELLLEAHDLCNRYGLDCASAGSVIAWAMELYQRGIIDARAADGLELRWGNGEALLTLLERIALRQGFGDLLAEDGLRAARRIGKGAEDYFVHVKGQSVCSEERGLKGCALNIATASRGADHLRSRPVPEGMFLPADFLERLYGGPVSPDPASYEGKALMVTVSERWFALADMLEVCKFTVRGFFSPHFPGPEQWAPVVNACTGWGTTPQELELAAERAVTLERIFNLREGLSRAHDTLPRRYFEEETRMGPMAGQRIERDRFERMLDEYYELHGWDAEGVPRAETLERLGLEEEAKLI